MLDVKDLSLLEVLYLIGLLVLVLSAFIYAVYPLFCNCDNNSTSLDDIFFPEEACFACSSCQQQGQALCDVHCEACFQCMSPDLPSPRRGSIIMQGEERERDEITNATTTDNNNNNTDKQQEQPQETEQQQPTPGQRSLSKQNSVVQEDSKNTTKNHLDNSVLDEVV